MRQIHKSSIQPVSSGKLLLQQMLGNGSAIAPRTLQGLSRFLKTLPCAIAATKSGKKRDADGGGKLSKEAGRCASDHIVDIKSPVNGDVATFIWLKREIRLEEGRPGVATETVYRSRMEHVRGSTECKLYRHFGCDAGVWLDSLATEKGY